MKKLVALLMVSLMATSAFAVVDDDPDMLGVYFDLNADTNSISAAASVPFNMYFIITNPSVASIWGVEFGYDLVGGAGQYFRLAETLPGGALNVGDASNPATGDYVLGLASPLPAQPATVMATWNVLLLAPISFEVYLSASNPESIADGLPAMEIGGSIVPLGLSTGIGNAAAVVNGPAPVSVEEASFGSVKSLFR